MIEQQSLVDAALVVSLVILGTFGVSAIFNRLHKKHHEEHRDDARD